MSYFSGKDAHELDALRSLLLQDFEAFSKFCFKILTGEKLLHVDYYEVLFSAVQKMIEQESTRMIINIPPRAGKTLIVSQLLPLFAWARNPSGQTILTGFNSDVLAESSGYIRTIMTDPDFQLVFPDVKLDVNKKSVEKLGTTSAGVLHAIPTTGKLTGKGAGTLASDFAGILCIDDVIKPDDANSPAERDKINRRYQGTILSRLASETTPLVIIMQRLHADDLCGFIMKGNTSDTFDWLNIPGIITPETGSAEWYQKQIDNYGYTSVNPITYSLPESDMRKYEPHMFEGKEQLISSFWAVRKNLKSLLGLLEKDDYTFYSQYMGMPIGKGKAALKPEDIYTYHNLGDFRVRYTFVTADTAATTQTYSDYSVACFWAVTQCDTLLLIDSVIGKWEVPELIVEMREFWRKHDKFDMNRPTMKPAAFYMEDKSSGLFLNQQFLRDGTVNVRPVPRDGTTTNDKFSRFLNTIPYFRAGRIRLPADHEHTEYIRRELLGQSAYGSSTGHDDVADNVADATSIAFGTNNMSYEDWM